MHKNITTLFIGLLMFVTLGYSQKKGVAPKWPGLSYSYVKVYAYNLDNQLYGKFQPVKNNKPDPTVLGPGLELTAEQTKELLTIFNSDTRVLNDGLAGCYEPHHAFIFYNDKHQIVASSDICFLCEGIRFYPTKKYFKPLTTHTPTATKNAEKQLAQIKAMLQKTEIPVFEKSIDYITYGKALAKDTLLMTNDSVFVDLINSFSSLKSLQNNISAAKNLNIDSVTRITGGGKKVNFYSIKGENTKIECSAYAGGSLWIVEYETKEKGLDVMNAVMVGDTKIEVYEAFKNYFTSFFYNSVLKFQSTNTNEYLIIGLDESSMVNYIKYHHYH